MHPNMVVFFLFFSHWLCEKRRDQGTAVLFLGVMTHQAWLSMCVQEAGPAPATGKSEEPWVASHHCPALGNAVRSHLRLS